MIIYIDGQSIKESLDFHKQLSSQLKISQYYGRNLDALWDLLSMNIERPLTLVWNNSQESKKYLGEEFDAIVEILDRVKRQDIFYNWQDKFNYYLK
ncbi:barstar family protein [Neisseria weaveri]|uniref:Ribonuclease inhibitor barstar n=1 Tax=Neisseria weaveri TaxID=28091 RepID=A0A3S5C908_9NEIS|nr:barstar family protein [Neisseria weaveri]EGV38399.1 hypothetical protein l13_01100 [Neisseria weaveri ATCC 51223]SAY50785.1 Ribonuclease inhibitor barstar [Neisseria weaveri]VEJ49077.1 Ribonuclease inhibitor barstar [Neisseria weaveri]